MLICLEISDTYLVAKFLDTRRKAKERLVYLLKSGRTTWMVL